MEISKAIWEAKSAGREIWVGTYVVTEISHVQKENTLEAWEISEEEKEMSAVVTATSGDMQISVEIAISPSMMLCWSPC